MNPRDQRNGLGITWYLVKRVLQTPVRSIIPTRMGMRFRDVMMAAIMPDL
jgi:hypothetical protein